MTNLENVRTFNAYELKEWFCRGRSCEECPYRRTKYAFGSCGFIEWLFSNAEPRRAKTAWDEEICISELHLKPQTFTALWEAEVRTMKQLYGLRFFDLAQIPGVGEARAWEIRETAEAYTGHPMRP